MPQLRKCPACKNWMAVESIECPICGCEPGKRRVRQIFIWALLVTVGLFVVHRVLHLI